MTVCVLGSVNLDITLQVEGLPLPGQTVAARSVSEHLGGKGANQAVAASRMGVEARFIGAVGDDAAGGWLRRNLSGAGVDVTHLIDLPGEVSGRAYISVAGSGQNSIVVAGGANAELQAEHVPVAAIGKARVLLSQLETPVLAATRLFSSPLASGATRILNAAPAVPEGRALFGLIDLLVVNETELMAYAGLAGAEQAVAVLIEAAAGLIERPDQAVVVTLGSAGAAIVRGAGASMIAGCKVRSVDSTGAGDCFCGVLAAELDRGADLEAAVFFANAAAALSVTRLGAASSAPTRSEVEAFLSRA